MVATSENAPQTVEPGGSTASRVRSLEQRLDEGYGRIEQAIERGDDVQRWETFWINLLHEYESLQNGLPRAA